MLKKDGVNIASPIDFNNMMGDIGGPVIIKSFDNDIAIRICLKHYISTKKSALPEMLLSKHCVL